MLRGLLKLGLVLLVALVIYLIAAPCPVEPETHDPEPPRELAGTLEANEALAQAEVFSTSGLSGPEDLLVEGSRITAGTFTGEIVELTPGAPPKVLARTGGRPLGLARDREGRLVFCDADRGLMRMEKDGTLNTLASRAGGRRFCFANELAIAADGTIYFTDSSDKYPIRDYCFEVVEGRGRGRLLKLDPLGKVSTLVDGLHFPNGCVLTAGDEALLYGETTRYVVNRLGLKGPKAGTRDVFCDRLPGFPDNISRSPRGTFWVALFSIRDPLLDLVGPHAWARRLVAKLPRQLWQNPPAYGIVLELDAQGSIVRSLHDPTGKHFGTVTSAIEQDGMLWLGTFHKPQYARLRL